MRNLLLNTFIMTLALSAFTASANEPEKNMADKLNHFRASAMMLQQGPTSSYSILGSWNPNMYRYKDSIFGLNLGASVFEDQEKDKFLFLEYMVTWRYLFNQRWKTELRAGFQTYEGEIGTHGALGFNVLYGLKKNKLHIDDVFIGYSRNSYSDQEVNQIRLGVAFHF